MGKRFVSLLKSTVLIAVLAALHPVGITYAESPNTATAGTNTTSAPVVEAPPRQEDDSRLNIRLQAAKKDLGVLPEFAEYFRNSGNTKALGQLQGSLDVLLKKHVDNLLALCTEDSNHDTIVLSAEVMYLKVRLFMILNQNREAAATVAEMKKRFASHSSLIVDVSGIITTIPEMIQQLDKELSKTAAVDKKQ